MLQTATKLLKEQFVWTASLVLILSQLVLPFMAVGTAYAGANDLSVSDHEGQLSPAGTYSNGNITTYGEGDSINFRFDIEASDAAAGQMQVEFTEYDGKCTFFDGTFSLGTHDSSSPAVVVTSGATPTVALSGTPTVVGGEWIQLIDVTYASAGEAVVNYYLTLSDEASECNGSSQHSRLGNSANTGDFSNIGAQNVPVPAKDVTEAQVPVIDLQLTSQCTIESGGARWFVRNENPTTIDFTWRFAGGGATGSETAQASGEGVVLPWAPERGANYVQFDTPESGTLIIEWLDENGETQQTTKATNPELCPEPQEEATIFVTKIVCEAEVYLPNWGGGTNAPATIGASTADDWLATGDNAQFCQESDWQFEWAADPTTNPGDEVGVAGGDWTLFEDSATVPVGNGKIWVREVFQDGYVEFTGATKNQGAGSAELYCHQDVLNYDNYDFAQTVVDGEVYYCVAWNAKVQAPQGEITVTKTVMNNDGGEATAANFDLLVNDTEVVSGVTNSFDAGIEYTVSETPQVDGYIQTSIDCTVDNQSVGTTFTLAEDQSVDCQIVNDDNAPTLIVSKFVVNDNGGTVEGKEVDLFVNGVGPLEDPFKDNTNPNTNFSVASYRLDSVKAGVAYTVTESPVPGYTPSEVTCQDTFTKESLTHPIALELGQNVTCSITNDDIAPRILVEKFAINDNGGTLDANDVNLYVNGQGPLDNVVAENENPTTGFNFVRHEFEGEVRANQSYTLTEDEVTGFAPSEVSCRDTFTREPLEHPVVPAPGQVVTCAISNDDIAPVLTVTKVVNNQWNGGLSVADFPLYVDGQVVVSGEKVELNAGNVIVSEGQQDGYQLVDVAGDCNFGGEITLEVGGVYTCTLFNNDQPAQIKVLKKVVNDNGGQAGIANFDLYVNKTEVQHDQWNSFNGNQSYEVSETQNVDGYVQTEIVCADFTDPNGRVPIDHPFEAKNGGKYVCQITNDDDGPTLQLKKTVINDNGGNNLAADWTLTAEGAETTYIDNPGIKGGDTMVLTQRVPVVAGDPITLSESGPRGYAASDWDCSGGNWDNDQLYIGLGEDVLCEIINDDRPARITVVKEAISDDGGRLEAADFSLYLNNRPLSNPDPAQVSDTVTTATYGQLSVPSNTVYEISEDERRGYELEDIICEIVTRQGSEEIKHPFTPSEGQNIVCTVTNNDKPAQLTLVKQVVNDDGGRLAQDRWRLFADGPTTVAGRDRTESLETGVSREVSAGWYALSESVRDGYELTSIECNGEELNLATPRIRIRNGQDVTCVFVNDDIPPTLRLEKEAISVNDPIDQRFRLRAAQGENRFDSPYVVDVNPDTRRPNTAVITGEDGLNAGWVRISERVPENWRLLDLECFYTYQENERSADNYLEKDSVELRRNGAFVRLQPGDDVTCRFVNIEEAKVTVTKYWDVDQDGEFGEGESTLEGWTFELEHCFSKERPTRPLDTDTQRELIDEDTNCHISSGGSENSVVSNGYKQPRVQESTTGEDGSTMFTNLDPFGLYILSEQFQDGWNISDITCEYPDFDNAGGYNYGPNQYHIRTIPGAEIECFVGNYQDGQLLIEKTNNQIGNNLVDGDTVTYQITVTNPEDSGIVYDTLVYDLMPANIVYILGSGFAESSVRGALVSPLGGSDYVADGPATWEIGDLAPGEVVTLTYSAIIANDTEPGTYDNIAFTEGWSCSYETIILDTDPEDETIRFNTLDAVAVPLIDDDHNEDDEHENPCPYGYSDYRALSVVGGFANLVSVLGNANVGDGSPFVESPITVITPAEPQGFVLGLTTTRELANTGTPAILPPMVGLVVAGAALALTGSRSGKRSRFLSKFVHATKHIIIAFAFVVGMGGSASAATGNGWQLNVVDLPSVTTSGEIDIAYQVASIDGDDTFQVTLWQDGVQVDTESVATAFGDNGSFSVNGLADGSYDFAVNANNSGDAANKTITQTVVVDSQSPSPATYEGVEQNGNNFTLTFTVPAGSDATTVNIYASTEQEFSADVATLVGTVAATPGVAQSFLYEAPNDQTRYFALELMDEAGNTSELTGDSETVVTGGGATSPAVISAGVDATDGTAVLGEDIAQADDDTSEEGATDDSDNAEQDSDESAEDDSSSNRLIIALGAAVVVALGYIGWQRGSKN